MRKISYPDKAAWLADRVNHIGASEAPAIFGHGYSGQSAMATYVEKTEPDAAVEWAPEALERMEIGLLQEHTMRELFERRTEMDVGYELLPVTYVSEERPYLSATLDGEVHDDDGPAVWEGKNVGEYMAHDWDGDSIPLRVQIQVQDQMYVTGYQHAYVAALIGGNRFVYHRVERHDKFIASMLPVLDVFWESVKMRIPPPVDGSQATADALKRLYRQDDGKTITLPSEAAEWDMELEALKDGIKGMEDYKREFQNKIKAAIGDAAYGEIPGGGRYSWKTSIRQEKAREAREISIRTLRRLKK